MKANVKQQSENVNRVVNAISEEGKSLGAIVRNFLAVAESCDFAAYMLRTICKHENPSISLTVNEIKKRIIKAYPYKDNNNTLLKKDGELFVSIETYTGDIVRKAFYNAIGETKAVTGFTPATEEQITEHAKQKASAKEAAKAKRENENKEIESIKAFYERIMNAESKDIAWALILEQKSANNNHV